MTQATLFTSEDWKPLGVSTNLDEAGKVLRDRGIKQAISNTENRHPGWTGEALDMLKRFLRTHYEPFQAEDVRAYADMMGLPKCSHNRAWGAVMVKARNMGIIEFVGYRAVKNPNCHCTPASLWRRKE